MPAFLSLKSLRSPLNLRELDEYEKNHAFLFRKDVKIRILNELLIIINYRNLAAVRIVFNVTMLDFCTVK